MPLAKKITVTGRTRDGRQREHAQRVGTARLRIASYTATPRRRHAVLKAYFAPAGETLPQGVDRFHALATEFVGANPFVEGWIVVRTPQDHAAKTGLYVLENNDEFLDFLRKRKTRDDHFTINASAFSTQINPGDRYTATGTINYSGGTSKFRSDKLYFSAGASDVRDNNLTLQEYLTMIRLIVAWRELPSDRSRLWHLRNL